MAAKILLTEWAKRRYQPAPSAYVLRKLIAEGALHPAPEKVGRDWYIEEHARRIDIAEQTSRHGLVAQLMAQG